MNTPPTAGQPSMADEAHWDALSEQWTSSSSPADEAGTERTETRPNHGLAEVATADLARRVRRQSRVLWWVGAAELAVCLITLLLAADFAFGPRRSEPWSLPTAAGLALLVFVAGRQAWSSRRGLWTESSARDHAGYLRLLQQRLEARERGVAFSWRLIAGLFVAFCIWLPLTRTEGLFGSFAFLVFWCGCAAALTAWLGRRAHREREGLATLRGGLEDEASLR